MIIPLLGIFSFPMTPMLYALGRSDAPLKSKLVGTLVFFLIIAPLSWKWGVMGAAMSLVIGTVTQVILLLLHLRREYRRVRSK
jgi:O-antigen/teichoic acid export membrane protein